MNRTTILVLLVALVAAPAAAQKVYVDYSPLADFDSYKTFAWGETPEVSIYDNNPLNHSRIKHTIEYYLIKGGMTEDTDNPDLYVTYYGEVDTDFSVNIFAAAGYAYPTDWVWDPYWGNASGTTTTTTQEEKAGTLVIDLWDAKTKKIVWRGTMEGTLSDDLRKGAKKIEKGIAKMVKKWQRQRAKDLAK